MPEGFLQMTHKRRHRLRRLAACGSPILLAGGAGMITALGTVALAYFTHGSEPKDTISTNPTFFWSVLVGVIVGLGAMLFQWWAEYRKRTYDPTWALKLGEIYRDMRDTRARAALSLKQNAGKLRSHDFTSADIDGVLDFFEDVGFYLRGDQMTPEVAHHYFHYSFRGYYSATREYIETAQAKEPTNWEHVHYLFDALHEIEVERDKDKHVKFLDHEALTTFLDDEISRAKPTTDKQGG
jgi:hypothetical protein